MFLLLRVSFKQHHDMENFNVGASFQISVSNKMFFTYSFIKEF